MLGSTLKTKTKQSKSCFLRSFKWKATWKLPTSDMLRIRNKSARSHGVCISWSLTERLEVLSKLFSHQSNNVRECVTVEVSFIRQLSPWIFFRPVTLEEPLNICALPRHLSGASELVDYWRYFLCINVLWVMSRDEGGDDDPSSDHQLWLCLPVN